MAIAFRDSATTPTFTSAGTGNITIPATVQVGDYMLVACHFANGVTDWNIPAGWAVADPSGQRSIGTGSRVMVIHRYAQSGDAGSTLTLQNSTASGKVSGVLTAWSGVDPVTPVHQIAWTSSTSPGTSIAGPAVTTTVDQCHVLSILTEKDGGTLTTITAPAGYTARGSQHVTPGGGASGTAVASKGPQSPGTYGADNWTTDVAPTQSGSYTIALAPAVATQTTRPISDVTKTNATGVPDNTNHYVDLAADADTSYVEMTSGGVEEVKFASLVDPATGSGHQISYRACYAGGATSATLQAQLVQGSTVIATFSHALTSAFTTYTDVLTSTQADSISDYTNLRVRFTVTAVA